MVFDRHMRYIQTGTSEESHQRAQETLHWISVLNGMPPPQQDMRRFVTGHEDELDKAVSSGLSSGAPSASPSAALGTSESTDLDERRSIVHGNRKTLPDQFRQVAWGHKLKAKVPKRGRRRKREADRERAIAEEYDSGMGLFSRPHVPDPAEPSPPELDFIGPAEERHKPVLLRDLGTATFSDLVFNPTYRPKTITALAVGKGSAALAVHRRWAGFGSYSPNPHDLMAFGTDGLGSGAYMSESESDENDENDDAGGAGPARSTIDGKEVVINRWSIVHRPETIVEEDEDSRAGGRSARATPGGTLPADSKDESNAMGRQASAITEGVTPIATPGASSAEQGQAQA